MTSIVLQIVVVFMNRELSDGSANWTQVSRRNCQITLPSIPNQQNQYNAMGSSRHDMDMVNPYLHPMVLTSSGGHRKMYGWQAGGTHPTGMLSCMGNVLVICATWLAFFLFFHEFCLHFK